MLPLSTAPDGTRYRDLNGSGVLDPYKDPRLDARTRALDLVSRMTVEEKVGQMFHPAVVAGREGELVEGPTPTGELSTRGLLEDQHIRHFYTFEFSSPRAGAEWHNRLQELAEQSRLGIPMTIATDPRNSFVQNPGAGSAARGFSQWPESLGLAALRSEEVVREYADIARQEYIATGIRAAVHPQVDLPTHPRWARQYATLGVDPDLASRLVVAYLDGFQRSPGLGADSVACTTKHFPGGGAQKDGEDPHFVYGREQVYPGGRFEQHLAPFRASIEAGTSAIMPYYGMPVGLVRNGVAIPERGFGFNRPILHDLLREELGFTGVVLTDFTVVTDGVMFGRESIGRAWGVEHLTPKERVAALIEAGVDQIGGEECTGLLVELVADGTVSEARLDESVLRLLIVKFELGLFENPFVDVDAAAEIVGRADFVRAGRLAQSRTVTILSDKGRESGGAPVLPLDAPASESASAPNATTAVYLEGLDARAVGARGFHVVDAPADADLALVRIAAPWEHRDRYALEAFFHAGSTAFDAETEDRLVALAESVPTIIDIYLERPALMNRLVDAAAAVTANWGTSDEAWLDVVLGVVPAEGRLPLEVPSSDAAIDAALPDVPAGSESPLFPLGHGLGSTAAVR